MDVNVMDTSTTVNHGNLLRLLGLLLFIVWCINCLLQLGECIYLTTTINDTNSKLQNHVNEFVILYYLLTLDILV